MITWNLTTIDWTAIGSIVTFVALVATFIALFFSNRQEKKNRQLQVLLLRQEQQQKRLDEMIENILEIFSDIDLFNLSNYSKKIKANNISVEDRYQIDNLSTKSEHNYNQLQLQYIKLNNYASAQPILHHLNAIRVDYGIWAKSVAMILVYLQEEVAVQQENFDIIKSTYNEMLAKCVEIDPQSISLLNARKNHFLESFIEDYKDVLIVFSYILTQKLLKEKEIFMNELKAFVKIEQKRIDNIVIANE